MDLRERGSDVVRALPVAHRIGIAAAAVGLVMASVVFFSWITRPSMTVLSSGLDDADLAGVVQQLEAAGTPYEIGAGGSTVLVSQESLYATRAMMAQSGVTTGADGEGWELLDEQGIAVSQDRQDIDFQRALSGELERTLVAFDGVRGATVHLVLPEDRLFTEQQEPTTASVLLDTARPLDDSEVEAVTFLVASSVEGLGVDQVTVADATGAVLHAPGDGGVGGTMGKQLQQQREYEQALAADVRGLLQQATGSTASVVVRARMNFDAVETSITSYDEESQVAGQEKVVTETFEGADPDGEGVVGVDGGPLPDDAAGGGGAYENTERISDFLVDSTVQNTLSAPARVEGMSVAIVMDDGTLTGSPVPADGDVTELVTAALGLEEARGDQVALTAVPFPAVDDEDDQMPTDMTAQLVGLAPQVAGAVVLLVVAIALFLMSRRRDEPEDAADALALEGPAAPALGDGAEPAAGAVGGAERVVVADMRPDPAINGRTTAFEPATPPDDTARREVEQLVDRQPEEIASLLRGWLADADA